MMKKVIFGSVVTAALIFTGCGSDDDDTTAADTVKPAVQATASGAGAAALTLATDAGGIKKVTLGGADAAKFSVGADNKVTLPATPGTYNITVTAEDKAGNKTTQAVVVTVTGGNTGGGAVANEVDMGANGKWVKIQTEDTNDDVNTTDVNETSFARISHADAATFCTNLGAGWTLPTQDDILSISTSHTVADKGSISGQIVLDTKVLEAGSAATTSVIWTSEDATSGVYLGNSSTDGNAQYAAGAADSYYHTCVKK